MLTSEEGHLSKSEEKRKDLCLLLLEVIIVGRWYSVKLESEKLFKQDYNKISIEGMFWQNVGPWT